VQQILTPHDTTAYFGAVLIFSSIDTVYGGNYSDIARKIAQYNTFTKHY